MVIDWSGIRAASVTLGIRAAARSAASTLTPEEQNRFVERVMKRASRERWQEAQLAIIPAAPAQTKPLSAIVRTGAELIASEIADDKLVTRSGLARYTADAARKLKASSGELKLSRPAKDIADIMGKVWPEAHSSQGTSVNIALLTGQVAVQYNSGTEGVSE